jgi:hypothetical protein
MTTVSAFSTWPRPKPPTATSMPTATAASPSHSSARRGTRARSVAPAGRAGANPVSPRYRPPRTYWASPSSIPTPATLKPRCQFTDSPSQPTSSGAANAPRFTPR